MTTAAAMAVRLEPATACRTATDVATTGEVVVTYTITAAAMAARLEPTMACRMAIDVRMVCRTACKAMVAAKLVMASATAALRTGTADSGACLALDRECRIGVNSTWRAIGRLSRY